MPSGSETYQETYVKCEETFVSSAARAAYSGVHSQRFTPVRSSSQLATHSTRVARMNSGHVRGVALLPLHRRLIDMLVAKAGPPMAKHYDDVLVPLLERDPGAARARGGAVKEAGQGGELCADDERAHQTVG